VSAFAEPLAQARENVDHAEALLTRDPFGEAERGLAATLLREALAALDLIEQRAGEMEDKAHERAKRASAITADAYQARVQRAEQRAADMEKALRELVDAVRILDVMLREPAAKGLMSAEDYRSYLSGAWLGVDEKTAAARAALSAREEAQA